MLEKISDFFKKVADTTGVTWFFSTIKKAFDIEFYTGIGRLNLAIISALLLLICVLAATGFIFKGNIGSRDFSFQIGNPYPQGLVFVLVIIFVLSGAGCLLLVYKADEKKLFEPADYKKKTKKR